MKPASAPGNLKKSDWITYDFGDPRRMLRVPAIIRTLLILLVAASPTPLLAEENEKSVIPVDLDPLLSTPGNWQMTPQDFSDRYREGENAYFVWLTKDHTRAKLSRKLYADASLDLNAFAGKVPVEEVIVDFATGKLNLVTLSIYNRGDGGGISGEEFSERFKSTGKAMGENFKVAPRQRKADPNDGLLTEGFSWYSRKTGLALLEHNEGAMDSGKREFLRLRVARPDAKGALAKSMSHSRGGAALRLDDLPRNVAEEKNGDVYVGGLPMVDQGTKGYCVVAAAQRMFEYLGIGADMHQIAQIADSDPEKGTNIIDMAMKLGKIDYRFKTRMDVVCLGPPGRMTEVEIEEGGYYPGRAFEQRKFLKEIHNSIDDGVPLLWALELGLFPEKPELHEQVRGGHMRMIIGYNDKAGEILFSDSWGAGHELKRMKMEHAYAASVGLFILKPTVH